MWDQFRIEGRNVSGCEPFKKKVNVGLNGVKVEQMVH